MIEDNSETVLSQPLAPNSKDANDIPHLVFDFNVERRKLAIEYTRTSKKYNFILMIVSLLLSLVFLLSRLTIWYRDLIVEYITNEPILIIGVFFITGFILISFWELPLSFYIHANLSRKYGLSKLTNIQWIRRYFKGEFLTFLIGLPIFQGFYFLLRYYPDSWWIWATMALFLLSLLFSVLVPIFILPLFYKFDPLEKTHPEFVTELLQMADQTGVKVTNAFNWHLGEVATTGNAGLMGIGPTRRIIIADTMLSQYTKDEIKWILAHEFGHHRHHDLRKNILLALLTTFLLFFLSHLMFPYLVSFFGYSSDISDVSNIPILGLSFWLLNSFIFNVPSLWYSRKLEKATDKFASTIVSDFNVIKSLFIKMADQNLADLCPPWWEKYFFLSHPPIEERMQYLEDFINNLTY
ncbi:MAG: hypothetical protein EAX86_04345 [Candidatus Heimdallarchaeota archaeon]|nr:hypothetical protein [Candidatus Heimdallarchaeota archaeon]